MPAMHLNQTTTLSPEEFVAGLTDFGAGREKVFVNSIKAIEAQHNGVPVG